MKNTLFFCAGFLGLSCLATEDLSTYRVPAETAANSEGGPRAVGTAAEPVADELELGSEPAPSSSLNEESQPVPEQGIQLTERVPASEQSEETSAAESAQGTEPVAEPEVTEPEAEEPSEVGGATESVDFNLVQGRFVRLVSLSAVNGSPYASIAELSLLNAEGEQLSPDQWIATADSFEFRGGAFPQAAIDGDPTSMWHTPWFAQFLPPVHPHFLQIDLGESLELSGFKYLPRGDGVPDGILLGYELYVSADGVEWGEPVVAGEFSGTDNEQVVQF